MLNVLLLLLMISQVSEMKSSKNNYPTKTVNVKTVLFRETDRFRDCWSHRETSLLITRYHMQMLIPSGRPDDVKILSEYLTLCLSIVLQESKKLDKSNRLILTEASCDVLGGYINSYGLPFVFKMLYAGMARIATVKKLIDLSENFKSKLDTNGRGWITPIHTDNFLENVTPAKIVCNAYFDFCDALIFDNSTHSKNGTTIESCNVYSSVPLPILDNSRKPNAIGLPIKGIKVTNLNQFTTRKPILTIYYKTVTCCGDMLQLSSKVECTRERAHFVRKFSNWLNSALVTLLNDNVCHPPLMGILKLKRTVNKSINHEKAVMMSITRSKENKKYNLKQKDSPVTHFIFFMISFFITALFWAVIFSLKSLGLADRRRDSGERIPVKLKFREGNSFTSNDSLRCSADVSDTEVKTKIKFTESFSNQNTQDVTAHYLFECNRNNHHQSEFSDEEYDTESSSTNGK